MSLLQQAPRPGRVHQLAETSIKGDEKDMICHKEVQEALKIYTPRPFLTIVGVSVMILSTAGFAGASPITNLGTGILNAGDGSVVVSGNGTTSGCINWYNDGAVPTTCPDVGGEASLTVEGGSTAPFTAGQTGTIQDLSFQTVTPLVDFIVVNRGAAAALQFDLEDLRFNGGTAIGDCTAGANDPGVTCTPANSPFQLTNGLTDPNTGKVDTVSVSFTVDAWGYKDSSGTNYNAADMYVGTFTTQQAIQGSTIASILGTIADGGSVSASWSATFSPETSGGGGATAPEPPPYILMAAGLMTVGLFRRKVSKS